MDIDLTLLVQMGLVAILVGILGPWVFAPLLEVIDRRAQAIQGTRAEAHRLEHMAAADEAVYAERMREAQREASRAREAERQAGREEAAELVGQARAAAAARWLGVREQIDGRARAVADELAGEVDGLAAQVVGRLIGERP